MSKQEDKRDRRDFIFTASYAVGAVGIGATIWPLIHQMNPDESVKALATTEVDISQVEPGKSITVLWRGKPVFLKRRTQELRDADLEFMVQKAATRQEIERARLIAEDETKSAKERLENLKVALDLEEKTTQRELELASERLAIQEQEMAQSENLIEDEQKLASLKVELIEKETASIKMRRRVVTEVNALEREIHAEEQARLKERKEAFDERFGDIEKMPSIVAKVNNELIQADNDYIAQLEINQKKKQYMGLH